MNTKLNKAIKQYYLDLINAIDLADIYYSESLYSAACGYYQSYLCVYADLCDDIEKSYCLCQIGKCYLKQTNNHLSQWQYQLIYEVLHSAINYNPYNYKAYLTLAELYKLREDANSLEKLKDIYYLYEFIIMNTLDKIDDEDNDNIANIIIEYYESCEHFFICKYKNIESKIFKFINSNQISRDLYIKIVDAISKNRNKPEDEYKLLTNSVFK